MNYGKFPGFWFAGHQLLLLVFSIWHLIYHLQMDWRNTVIAGFFVGFGLHCMLFFAWSIILWTDSTCLWVVAFPTGIFGWLISLILVASLDHWTMVPFLLATVIWPFALFYKVSRAPGKIEDAEREPTSLFVQAFWLLRYALLWNLEHFKNGFFRLRRIVERRFPDAVSHVNASAQGRRKRKKK
jgi:hypothetical protein